MKRFLFCMAACLPVLASASSYALSGKVTDKSGNGVAGIWVGLTQAKIATLTASDGSWSLGAASGIATRAASRTAVTSHLVNEGGHLRISFDGKDLSGRNLSGTAASAVLGTSGTGAARAADAISDTLLYVNADQNTLAITPVTSSSFQAGIVVLDTTRSVTFTKSGDTLYTLPNPYGYADIYCNDSILYVDNYTDEKGETDIVRMTSEGMELTLLDDHESSSKYQNVVKFSRLSGTAGSLAGRFQVTGYVYRPLIANMPDSVVKILADDSVRSAAEAKRNGLIYTFTDNASFLSGQNALSFANQFLVGWTQANNRWYYYDSAWHDDRKYSDSAEYNITAQVVDSSTIRLTGNTTQEVVTLTGTLSANGFNKTYVSTNSAHASGTNLAIPTACPEAVTWYSSFLSANPHVATAARASGSSAMLPKHKKSRRLF